MLKGVTVSELKDILAKVEPPKRLMDPITELPSEWDQTIIQKIKNAKSKEEILHLEEPVKATMPVDLNQVHPRIWIGNFKAAKSIDVLKSNGITDVFNVAEGKGFGSCGVFDQAPYKEAGLSYHGMVIRDNVDAKDGGKQQALFSEAADVIETILSKEGTSVLVHCFGGFSRSTSSVLAYLFLKEKMDLREALKMVKSKRDVLPSTQQLAHLAGMYNTLHGLEAGEESEDLSKIADYRMLSRQQK